jgi:DNA-binding transcriptional MerR regulator
MNERFTVGELAERTGLTVRTLHHYDQIGLLRPFARTPAGYRLYGTGELRRLQHIASLRHLGLSLDDVKRCLDEGDPPLPEVLRLHAARLDAHLRATTEQRDRLLRLGEDLRDETDPDAWLQAIHDTLRWERFYSPEQREVLSKRADDLGLGRLAEAESEWIELFTKLGDAVDEDLSPVHPRVAVLARRARGLIAEFTGGDPGLEGSLRAMYEAQGSRPLTERGIHVRSDVWSFLGSAMEALRSNASD